MSLARQSGSRAARAAAIVTWVYAAAYALPAIPVGIILVRTGQLPWLWDLFPMFGGPWSESVSLNTLAASLAAFLGLSLVVVWGARLLWSGRRSGAVICVAFLPLEALFWYGYALPIPVVLGVARAALIVMAWTRLRRGEGPRGAPARDR